jgi:hypothetical protein
MKTESAMLVLLCSVFIYNSSNAAQPINCHAMVVMVVIMSQAEDQCGYHIRDVNGELQRATDYCTTGETHIDWMGEGFDKWNELVQKEGKEKACQETLKLCSPFLQKSNTTIKSKPDGQNEGDKSTSLSRPPATEPNTVSAWGITVQNLTPELAQKFGVDEKQTGVIITDLVAESPAAEARLKNGDIIEEVNRQKIQNIRDWKQAIEKMKKGEPLLLLVKRGANTFYVAIKAAAE